MSICRLTMVCSAMTIWAPTTMGSTPAHGRGAVGLLALNADIEALRARHEAAVTIGRAAGHPALRDVQPKDRGRRGILQGALGNHQIGAAFFPFRRPLLRRLEDELDRARNDVAQRAQDLGRAHEDGDVVVVTTCMHDADLVAFVHAGDLRRVGQAGFLDDRQPIHVGAERNDAAGLCAPQHADDAGMSHLRFHLETERTQMLGDERGGAELAIGQLRMLVDVAAPCDDLVLDLGRLGGDCGIELRLRGRANPYEQRANQTDHRCMQLM